jgi:hypothetical protein
MAPSYRSRPSNNFNDDSSSSGLSAGAIVGIVIVVLIATFLCVVAYKFYQAKKRKQPIQMGTILKEATVYAFCGACIVCMSCFGGGNNNNNQGNDGGAQTSGNDGGQYVPGPQMQMPMPQGPQPGMNWEPVQGAAQDGVQG